MLHLISPSAYALLGNGIQDVETHAGDVIVWYNRSPVSRSRVRIQDPERRRPTEPSSLRESVVRPKPRMPNRGTKTKKCRKRPTTACGLRGEIHSCSLRNAPTSTTARPPSATPPTPAPAGTLRPLQNSPTPTLRQSLSDDQPPNRPQGEPHTCSRPGHCTHVGVEGSPHLLCTDR